jgi:NADP-dependent 3-hydroxy acid dehydrogenase YdfG
VNAVLTLLGIVETEFSYVVNKSDPSKADSLYKSLEPLKSEDIADHVKFIMEAPRHVQIHDILVRPTEQKF